uniref:Disease resistance protein At4g27190-like leucine-rich repeats domain-containing protein n=1 Tax=Gossypium raimondii TaxID=29730 RepID=A0A0D2SET4_GOSRA|nr:hypothetical protein B456_009G374000 [Gossypium raimondii]
MGCGFCEAALCNTVETLVVDCVVKRVGRQLDYVRRFHDNVEKLREKKRELADARDRLLHKIEDAKNWLLLIDNDVQNLQSRAAETLSDMGTLEEEIQLNKRCLNWCPNWSWRYQLSKKAMKKIQDIPELLEKFGQLGLELVIGKMTNEQLSNLQSCKYEELEQYQTSSQHHPLPLCFPNLILLDILECESLKSLFSIIVAQGSSKKLNAPNLQTLWIRRCFGMKEIIQDSQVPTISFQCLREVQVTECNKLKFIFPMCVANSLGQLQTLRIESCFQLQEIIQRPDVLISMSRSLERLNEVELINLPQLKGRGRNDIVLTSLSLHVLRVIECPQLTPFIVPTNIQELYFLEITEKKQISNVTVPKRRGGTSTCTEYLTISNFEELFEYSGYNLSSLKILKLSELIELRVIWTGPIQVEHFQNLTELAVFKCRRLRYIFSPTIARNLPQLWTLVISNCEELEQIIEKDQTSSQHHLQPICFPNLSWITIIDCENLKCLFPITLAHGGLPNLVHLYLRRVSKLEQVFEGDESNVSKDGEKVICLPRLNDLVLGNLPNLVSFSPAGYHFVFPFLIRLTVEGCPNITTRFSVDSEKSVHAKTQASQSVDEIIVEESLLQLKKLHGQLVVI